MTYTPGIPNPNRYLDARVTTATQPELQLLLLDGAVRFGRQAERLFEESGLQPDGQRMLTRAIDIVEELVRSVSGSTSDAAKRLAEEYAFAYRQLAVASLGRDRSALIAALRVLTAERETWRIACEQLKSAGNLDPTVVPPARRTDVGGESPRPAPLTGFGHVFDGGSSLSLEA